MHMLEDMVAWTRNKPRWRHVSLLFVFAINFCCECYWKLSLLSREPPRAIQSSKQPCGRLLAAFILSGSLLCILCHAMFSQYAFILLQFAFGERREAPVPDQDRRAFAEAVMEHDTFPFMVRLLLLAASFSALCVMFLILHIHFFSGR